MYIYIYIHIYIYTYIYTYIDVYFFIFQDVFLKNEQEKHLWRGVVKKSRKSSMFIEPFVIWLEIFHHVLLLDPTQKVTPRSLKKVVKSKGILPKKAEPFRFTSPRNFSRLVHLKITPWTRKLIFLTPSFLEIPC